MKIQSQKRIYMIMAIVVVAVLMAAQIALYVFFRKANTELAVLNGQIAEHTLRQSENLTLVNGYNKFEESAPSKERLQASYPSNSSEFYAFADSVFRSNGIDYSNTSAAADPGPGGELKLQISFNGQYYNVLKSLAAFRTGNYLMRVGDFSLTGEADGRVNGKMTILSTAKSE
ncbi:hypothetical protein FACS1894167_03450 [Synergistales bacterium]|nr:hypothetical protein FACS1894167_03450 [Synergistales bacterium]GHV50639.1 hypothetical protein FACS1894216_03190 [Synergistales bacterium]